MENFDELARQGALSAWLYVPAGVILGALHGLEPGHSKTMMAAFIIAVRGTIFQAVLLGLCAAFSHSLVIWLLAALALSYGSSLHVENTEGYFQIGSAVIIFGLALWMAWRTWCEIENEKKHEQDHAHHHHGDKYQDAHELAHAREIEQRFAGRSVTTGQVMLFGLTGGLLPCPAAFSIVLVCLQLKRFALGLAMVLSFSFGLAVTLVATGALAAWSLHHAQKHFAGLGALARKLPFFSSGLLALIACYLGWQGWLHLP